LSAVGADGYPEFSLFSIKHFSNLIRTRFLEDIQTLKKPFIEKCLREPMMVPMAETLFQRISHVSILFPRAQFMKKPGRKPISAKNPSGIRICSFQDTHATP
jgi:hypothetical protein